MQIRKAGAWSKAGLAALVVLTMALAGGTASGQTASSSSPSSSSSHASSTLTIGTTTQVQSLDPRDANDTLGLNLVANFNGSLYRANPNTSGKPIPELAVGAPVESSDGLTYTVTLRPGIKFGDGTPLTAKLYADQFNG